MNVAVVVATYNERDNLSDLAAAILHHPGYRLIIVDDNSPDGTGAIADSLSAAFPGRVTVIHRTGPRGLGRSLIEGMKRALADGADFIFEMDADFSHDPTHLATMAECAAEADLVIGSRYLNGGISVVNWPLARIMLSAFANRYVRFVTGLKTYDCTSGYRCWRRAAIAALPLDRFISDGYSFLVEMLFVAARSGCRIAEVPITYVERREGESKVSRAVLVESAITPWRLIAKRETRRKAPPS